MMMTIGIAVLIKGINTWGVLLVRYSGPLLKKAKEELQLVDQRKRKVMTMRRGLAFNGYILSYFAGKIN